MGDRGEPAKFQLSYREAIALWLLHLQSATPVSLFDYLLIRELLGRGGARQALITWGCLFCLVVMVWVLAGQDAVGALIQVVLYGGVVAILCLPLLGLFLAAVWLVAMSCPADKKLAAAPAGRASI